MATVTININGISEGWTGASGVATDIDEAIAGADGNEYGPGANADSATFDLSAHGLSDGDTITNVSITVRVRDNGTAGNKQCQVDFLISGSPVGSPVTTANLGTTHANYGPLNDTGWNSDWTAAQLDGAQVRLTPTQSAMPGTNAQYVDCVDVVITYTPAATNIDVPVTNLTFTEYAPAVAAGASVAVGLTNLTFTGYAPAVEVGGVQVNNFTGFETEGHEEASATNGTVTYSTTAPRSGNANLVVDTNNERYDLPWVTDGVTDKGTGHIIGFAFKASAPWTVNNIIFEVHDNIGSSILQVRCLTDVGTGYRFELRDANNGNLSTATELSEQFKIEDWNYIEIYADLNSASGNWEWWINGKSVASGTAADLTDGNAFGSSSSYVRLEYSNATDTLTYNFDDVYILSGATPTDRLGPRAAVYAYQAGKVSASPDFDRTGAAGGTALDTGTWDDTGQTPATSTAGNIAIYSLSSNQNGAVALDDTNAGGNGPGPRNTGVGIPRAYKYHLNARYVDNAGTNSYELVYGKNVDAASTATVNQSGVTLTTSYDDYFVLIEGTATEAPAENEWAVIGFSKVGTGADDLDVAEMWVHALTVRPQINNFTGFETEGNEESDDGTAYAVTGTLSYDTTNQRSGSSALLLEDGGTEAYELTWTSIGRAGAGASADHREVASNISGKSIFGFAFRFTAVVAATSVFLEVRDDSDNIVMSMQLDASEQIVLRDAVDGTLDTSGALNAGQWYYIEVYWDQNSASSDWEWWIDDVSQGSGSGADFTDGGVWGAGTSHLRFINTRGAATSDYLIDDVYIMTGISSTTPRLGSNVKVVSYQGGKTTAASDFDRDGAAGGTSLTAGTWDDAGQTPTNITATNYAEYSTDVTIEGGAIAFNDTNAGGQGPGPRDNLIASDTIKAAKYHWHAQYNETGAGANSHKGLYGYNVNASSTAKINEITFGLSSSEWRDFFFMLQDTDPYLPAYDQWAVMGFWKSASSNDDVYLGEQWAHFLVVGAGAGGVDLSIPLTNFTFTSYAPAQAAGKNVAVGLTNFTFTSYAPAQAAGKNVAVGLTNFTFTSYAPAQAAGKSIAVGVTNLTFTEYAPEVAGGKNLSIGVTSLTFSGTAPNVAAGKNLAVPLTNFTFTSYVPTVAAGSTNIDVPLTNLTLTTYAPAVAAGKNISVPLTNLTLTTYAPTVVAGSTNIDVPVTNLTFTSYAPAVAAGKNIAVGVTNLTLTSYAPAVGTGINVIVGLTNFTFTEYAPAVASGTNITTPLFSYTLTGYAPTVTAGSVGVTINNFTGFETEDNNEAYSINGTPTYDTSTPISGASSLVLDANGEDYGFAVTAPGVTDAGVGYIIQFKTSVSANPSQNKVFLSVRDDAGASLAQFMWVGTSDSLRIFDSNGASVHTSTSSIFPTDGSTFEVIIYADFNSESGNINYSIDGNTGSVSAVDLGNGNGFGGATSYLVFENNYNVDTITLKYDDLIILSGASSINDAFSNGTEVASFQAGKITNVPDYNRLGASGGDNLTTGSWQLTGESPLDDTTGNFIEWGNTAAENGAVKFDDSNAAGRGPGPRNVLTANDTIQAVKYHWNARYINQSGATTYEGVYGKNIDGQSTATVNQISLSLTTSNDNYFYLINSTAAEIPAGNDWAVMGAGKGSGNDDLHVAEMWAHFLYTPEVFGNIPASSFTLTGYIPSVITDEPLNIPKTSFAFAEYAPKIREDINFNVASDTVTGRTGTDTFAHDPGASVTPEGVIVTISHANGDADGIVTSVTYGSATMNPVPKSPAYFDTGEAGTAYMYYLGAGDTIPTGNQTITVTVDNGAITWFATCISLLATAPIEYNNDVKGIDGLQVQNPSVLLNLNGRESFQVFSFFSGWSSPVFIDPRVNWSEVSEYDDGPRTLGTHKYDLLDNANKTVGYDTPGIASEVILAAAFSLAQLSEVVVSSKSYSFTAYAPTVTAGIGAFITTTENYMFTSRLPTVTASPVTGIDISVPVKSFTFTSYVPIQEAGFNSYYIDAIDGNNANDGKTPATAWKTTAAVDAFGSFNATDHLYFKNGQDHRAPSATQSAVLTIPRSGTDSNNKFVISSYGTGSYSARINAAIDGTQASNWTNITGNIWRSSPLHYAASLTNRHGISAWIEPDVNNLTAHYTNDGVRPQRGHLHNTSLDLGNDRSSTATPGSWTNLGSNRWEFSTAWNSVDGWTPDVLILNATPYTGGNKKSTLGEIVSLGHWGIIGGNITIYSTSNPDTNFGSVVIARLSRQNDSAIAHNDSVRYSFVYDTSGFGPSSTFSSHCEVGAQEFCIGGSQNYIRIENIEMRHAKQAVRVDGNMTGWEINDTLVAQTGRDCVVYSVDNTGTHLTITNMTTVSGGLWHQRSAGGNGQAIGHGLLISGSGDLTVTNYTGWAHHEDAIQAGPSYTGTTTVNKFNVPNGGCLEDAVDQKGGEFIFDLQGGIVEVGSDSGIGGASGHGFLKHQNSRSLTVKNGTVRSTEVVGLNPRQILSISSSTQPGTATFEDLKIISDAPVSSAYCIRQTGSTPIVLKTCEVYAKGNTPAVFVSGSGNITSTHTTYHRPDNGTSGGALIHIQNGNCVWTGVNDIYDSEDNIIFWYNGAAAPSGTSMDNCLFYRQTGTPWINNNGNTANDFGTSLTLGNISITDAKTEDPGFINRAGGNLAISDTSAAATGGQTGTGIADDINDTPYNTVDPEIGAYAVGSPDLDVPKKPYVVTPYSPTIQTGKTVLPGLTSYTLTPYTPQVATGKTITVTVKNCTFTGYIPSIDVSNAVSIPVPKRTYTLTPQLMTVGTGVDIDIPVTNFTISTYAPNLEQATIVAVGLTNFTFTEYAPAQVAGKNFAIPKKFYTLTKTAPALSFGVGAEVLVPFGQSYSTTFYLCGVAGTWIPIDDQAPIDPWTPVDDQTPSDTWIEVDDQTAVDPWTEIET